MKDDGNPVRPKARSAEYTPIVSVRLQMKRLLGEKPYDNYDNTGISRSNTSAPVEQYMRKEVNPSIPEIRQPTIMPNPLDRATSTDKTAISSIIVARDKSTFDIKEILFKDAHDPRQPDYVQLYPSARGTRGRIRCARAILCNQTTISDEHAPTDEQSSCDYLLRLLFGNLHFATIIDHAQANYGHVSNEELEKLRQEGLRQICRYFGRDEPSELAHISTPVENNNLESEISRVRTGTPLSDTDVSDSEGSNFSASAVNSPTISFSSMGSSPATKRSHDSPLEEALTGSKKLRLQSKLKARKLLGVNEVEGFTCYSPADSVDLFSRVFRLCREIKSFNVRIRVLKENIKRSSNSHGTVAFELGDSFISLSTYLDHELQKSVSAWKEASKRLDQENRRCRKMVKGNETLEKLYQRLSSGILSNCEKA